MLTSVICPRVVVIALALTLMGCDGGEEQSLTSSSAALSAKSLSNVRVAKASKTKKGAALRIAKVVKEEEDPLVQVQECVDTSDTFAQCNACCDDAFGDDAGMHAICVAECSTQCDDCDDDPLQAIQDCLDASETVGECTSCCEASFPDDVGLQDVCAAECEDQCPDDACPDPYEGVQACLDNSTNEAECKGCCDETYADDPGMHDICYEDCTDQCPEEMGVSAKDEGTCTPGVFAK